VLNMSRKDAVPEGVRFLFPGDGLLGEGLQNVITSWEKRGKAIWRTWKTCFQASIKHACHGHV
jgi:hypothetical protein